MIEDMDYHITAWHRILNDLGAGISLDRMKEECYGKNQELLERIFPGRFSEEEKNEMSWEKERQYQAAFRPELKLIAGLDEVLESAYRKSIKMAIGSAAIRFNIDFVLDGLGIRHYFDVIVSADDVRHSKPDPETYLACAEKLGIAPSDCLVLEDAPKGAESARRAGMDCAILTTMHHPDEFSHFPNVIGCMKDFTGFKV